MNPHPEPFEAPKSLVAIQLISCPRDHVAITIRWLAGYEGCMTHYKPRCPIYCPGPKLCDPSLHKLTGIWKAYAPIEVWRDSPDRDWIPAVFEVTERMDELLKGEQLRGQVWAMRRVPIGPKRAECTGNFCEMCDPARLRQPFNMLPILTRIYHTPHIVLGVPNPKPPRIFLEPSRDFVPKTAETVQDSPQGYSRKTFAKMREENAKKQAEATNGNGKH
jgi:hypothetical protein